MSPPQSNSILVVAGLGNGVGTGAASARLFAAKLGYKVALVSRPRKEIEDLASDINNAGGEAAVFSVDAYDHTNLTKAFEAIDKRWPTARLATAIWNAGQWSHIPFLDIKESDIQLSTQINIVAATAFAQLAIRRFLAPAVAELEGAPPSDLSANHKGSLIITGATSAWRGKEGFGAFAAGKHGARALSQSIAREYGPHGVHTSFVVIDGTIITKRTEALFGDKNGAGWLNDEAQRLSPDSIAKTYLFLHEQDPSAWTLELDLRPAKEKF